METNYRSAGAIVEKADAFIQRNGSRQQAHAGQPSPGGAGAPRESQRLRAAGPLSGPGGGGLHGVHRRALATTTAPYPH